LEKFVLKYVKDLNLKGFEIWFEKGIEKKEKKTKQTQPNLTRGPLPPLSFCRGPAPHFRPTRPAPPASPPSLSCSHQQVGPPHPTAPRPLRSFIEQLNTTPLTHRRPRPFLSL
jgi:hypothetical protein